MRYASLIFECNYELSIQFLIAYKICEILFTIYLTSLSFQISTCVPIKLHNEYDIEVYVFY